MKAWMLVAALLCASVPAAAKKVVWKPIDEADAKTLSTRYDEMAKCIAKSAAEDRPVEGLVHLKFRITEDGVAKRANTEGFISGPAMLCISDAVNGTKGFAKREYLQRIIARLDTTNAGGTARVSLAPAEGPWLEGEDLTRFGKQTGVFSKCSEKADHKDKRTGTVTLELQIMPDGSVVEPHIHQQMALDGRMTWCIEQAVKKFKLKPRDKRKRFETRLQFDKGVVSIPK